MRLRVMRDTVHGGLVQGWVRHKVLAKARHPVGELEARSASASATAPRPPGFEQAAAIEAVLVELAQTRSLKGAWLDVDLSDSLVQLDVVTGEFSGDSDRQLQAVAVACMAELLGDASQGHEIRWQLQADGAHLLIAAIEQDRLHILTEAAARHGLRLRSVQPDFCRQWNRHSSTLKPGSAVFAVASAREALIACVSHGAIVEISRGGWLDRHDDANEDVSQVNRLMSGFGLDIKGTAGLLDVRCDRLLASVGQDPAIQSAYVLVASAISNGAVSSRWTVLSRKALAP